MADLTIDQLPEATSISNDDIMIVAAANSSTAKKIKASLVVGRPSPGSGHVIVDGNGSDMPQRPNLQFAGETVSVVDDPTLGRTVVEVAGSELKPATTTTLGGVIVGKNIDVDAEGVISTLGGHTIQNPEGVALEQQPNLQFTGDFTTVINPADSQKTVVDVTVPLATTEKPGILQVGGGLDVNDTGVVSTVRGHEVVDPEGNIMAQEDQIQFTGDFITVTDDAAAKKTTVDVTVPFATKDKAGIVQVGGGISVSPTGVISVAGAEPKSYFPANASLRFWAARDAQVTYLSSIKITGFRWYALQLGNSSINTYVDRYPVPSDSNNYEIGFYIGQQSDMTNPAMITYPFTIAETKPLLGKTVTFSFDFAKTKNQVEGEKITFEVFGQSTGGHLPLLRNGSGYTEGTTPIESGSITDGTPTLTRKTFTFNIPQEMTQICLRWSYTGEYLTAVNQYVMRVAKPRIDIGENAAPYETESYGQEYEEIQKTQPTIYASYSGQITGADPAPSFGFNYRFPVALDMPPTQILSVTDTYGVSGNSGFAAININDPKDITEVNCRILRKTTIAADAGTVAGYYYGTYRFSVPLT